MLWVSLKIKMNYWINFKFIIGLCDLRVIIFWLKIEIYFYFEKLWVVVEDLYKMLGDIYKVFCMVD